MPDVAIEFKAMVDGAIAALNKVDRQALSPLTHAFDAAKKNTQALRDGFGLVQQGAEYVQQALDATVGVTTEYAKQVRDLSREIGASAEQTSMLIQAADDVGIEFGTLERAMEGAIRKGVKPSIEGMGALSDQYLAIQDPIERTKFLMDNFGRSGADLAPLMEKGSAGIKAMGEEAKRTGLVMSQEAVTAAREYEIALDNMNDQVQGLQVQLGKMLTPAVTAAAETAGKAATALNDEAKIVQLLAIKFQVATGQIGYFTASQMAAKIAGEDFNAMSAESGSLLNKLTDSSSQAAQAAADWGASMQIPTDALMANARTLEYQQQKAAEAAAADLLLADSLGAYAAALSGAVANEVTAFNSKQDELKTKNQEIQGEIDKLNAKAYLTPDQKQQLEDLRTDLDKNNTALKTNVEEHEKASKRIALSYLEQNLARGGMTQAEQDALMEVARRLGLVDQAGLQMYKDIGEAAAKFQATGDVRGLSQDMEVAANKVLGVTTVFAEQQTQLETHSATVASTSDANQIKFGEETKFADGFAAAIKNIPDHKTVRITTIYETVGSPPGGVSLEPGLTVP
jgi:hypothetical protein